jgi:predicted MPP superfamily phosphohydrolase
VRRSPGRRDVAATAAPSGPATGTARSRGRGHRIATPGGCCSEADRGASQRPGAGSARLDAGAALPRAVAAVTAGALSAGAVGIGVYQAMSPPALKRVPIRLAKLPASMAGFRIALVSDIHLGPLLGRSHTERIVRMINAVDADLVAVVGDLVDGSVAELGPAAEPLQDLRARHGSYFVTGNHEYFSGYQEWVDEVNSLGVRVLRNERVDVLGLDLAGVNDVTGGSVGDGPDFDRALDGRDAARPVVLLAHQPVQAREASRKGVDLQLSGTPTAGRWCPSTCSSGLQQPVVAGLGQVGTTQVYVTRGAGFWGPPVRFGAPPDISVIELHGA